MHESMIGSPRPRVTAERDATTGALVVEWGSRVDCRDMSSLGSRSSSATSCSSLCSASPALPFRRIPPTASHEILPAGKRQPHRLAGTRSPMSTASVHGAAHKPFASLAEVEADTATRSPVSVVERFLTRSTPAAVPTPWEGFVLGMYALFGCDAMLHGHCQPAANCVVRGSPPSVVSSCELPRKLGC
jgi:hypothetical protein